MHGALELSGIREWIIYVNTAREALFCHEYNMLTECVTWQGLPSQFVLEVKVSLAHGSLKRYPWLRFRALAVEL